MICFCATSRKSSPLALDLVLAIRKLEELEARGDLVPLLVVPLLWNRGTHIYHKGSSTVSMLQKTCMECLDAASLVDSVVAWLHGLGGYLSLTSASKEKTFLVCPLGLPPSLLCLLLPRFKGLVG